MWGLSEVECDPLESDLSKRFLLTGSNPASTLLPPSTYQTQIQITNVHYY